MKTTRLSINNIRKPLSLILISSVLNMPVMVHADSTASSQCDALASHPANKDNPEGLVGVDWHHFNSAKAIPICLQAVEENPDNLRYQFQLARAYSKKEQIDKAMAIYKKLAEQNYLIAQANLATLYENKGDYTNAIKWYTKSAEQGNAQAQFALGILYERGEGLPLSYDKAIYWFTKSAEQGYALAQNNLAVRYGMIGDEENYLKWMTLAAKNGNRMAQSSIGSLYIWQKDYEKAYEWYRKSAELGYPEAQYNIGYMYQHGIVVKQSDKEARKWYQKSAEQDYASSKKALSLLGNK